MSSTKKKLSAIRKSLRIREKIAKENKEKSFFETLSNFTFKNNSRVEHSESSDSSEPSSSSRQSSSGEINNIVFEPENVNIPPQIPPVVEVKRINMANHEAINTRITNMVPTFSGYESVNVRTDLIKFVQATRMAFEITENEHEGIFVNLLKFRLTGDVFDCINKRNINTVDELVDTLMDIYAKSQSIEELYSKCFNSSQKQNETTKQYGRRIQESLEEYKTGYNDKYNEAPNCTHARALAELAMKAFKKGIFDSTIRHKLLIEETEDLDEAISRAETIENIFASESNASSPITNLNSNITCSFCTTKGHVWETCQIRRNKPPCPICKEFGHDANDCMLKQQNSPGNRELEYVTRNFGNFNQNRNFNMQTQRNFERNRNYGQNYNQNYPNNNDGQNRNFNNNRGNRFDNFSNSRNWNQSRNFNNNPRRNWDVNFSNNQQYRDPNNRQTNNSNAINNSQQQIRPQSNNIQQQGSNSNNNTRNWENSGRPYCNYCHTPGHNRENCNRARNNARTNQNNGNMDQIENAMRRMDINQIQHAPHYSDPYDNQIFDERYDNVTSENYRGSNVLNEDNTEQIRH